MVRLKGHPTKTSTFHGRKTAEDWARDTEDALRSGKTLPGPSPTLSAVIDRYIKGLQTFKPVSDTRLGNLTRRKESLGDRKVASLTGQDVLDHAAKRCEVIGPATMQIELGYLAETLKAARTFWVMTIPDIVAAARPTPVRTGMIGDPYERDRRPTAEELKSLEAFYRYNLARTPMRDLIPFVIDSAMRLSEITSIRWEDYRPGNKPLVLIRSRKDPKKNINHQWVRSWDLAPRLSIASRRRVSASSPHKPDTIGSSFRRACLRLEIADLPFHDLRHEGTSRLFEANYDIRRVAIVTSHRDWKLLKRYTNLKSASLHPEKPVALIQFYPSKKRPDISVAQSPHACSLHERTTGLARSVRGGRLERMKEVHDGGISLPPALFLFPTIVLCRTHQLRSFGQRRTV